MRSGGFQPPLVVLFGIAGCGQRKPTAEKSEAGIPAERRDTASSISESLGPTWTLGYIQAAALVAERGAILSHGAIVAREFGIPAVVNVAGCISRLQTGQSIEVDGSKGSVTLTH
jgi:phosphoenolpyruvate-protein kinase (PTS system EI component)